MADWPPVAPVQTTPSRQEREKTYLQLVDMFVDIVEPDIIQMVLQNRNWDVDAALEDIMILTNSSQPDSAQHVNNTCATPEIRNQHKVKKNTNTGSRYENIPLNKFPPSYPADKVFSNPQDCPQVKQKKQMLDKPFQYKVPDAKKGNQIQLQPFIEQYNYVKATKIPFDRAVMMIKDRVKVMIILRGPPGCGKSYLARKLLLEGGIEPSAHKRHIFSSDEFFVQNNVYVFVPELLSQAHLWNQRSVVAAIREEVSPVIVDNTNTQAWEMRVYAEMAVSAGYDLEIVEPETWWFRKDGELAKRNVHGVPKAKIRQMIERYEKNITPDMLMKQFDLRYPLSKVPPQPARNCKWRDKLSNQRNNKPKKKKSDFSPKSQSNLGNINSMFHSFQINSSGFSQVGNDLTGQNSNAENFCFTHQVNFKEERKISSNELRTKKETKTSSSYKNGDSTQSVQFDESDTNKLFENLVINSSSFLKSISEASKSSQDPVTVQEQSNDGDYSGNPIHRSKDSFDFMAETKKLLEALNRPSPSHAQSSNFSTIPSQGVLVSETMKSLEPPQFDVLGKILVCKESEIFLPDEQYSNNKSEFCQNVNLEKESNLKSEEKIRVADDLVDSIIDKAINDTKGLDLNLSYVDLEKVCDKGLSWDYVVVNNDNTFTYQRRNSIPIGLPVVITDNTEQTHNTECFPSPFVNNAISPVKETGYQFEVGQENIETIVSSGFDESKFNKREKEPLKLSHEDLTLHNCLEGKNESHIEEKNSQLDNLEESVAGINSGFADKNEESHLDSGKKCTEQTIGTGENSKETGNISNPNVFEMMKDILCTLGPLNDSYNSSFGNNPNNSPSETKTSNISQEGMKPPSIDNNVHSFTIPISESFANWNVGGDWDSNKSNTNDELQPKPARSLRRPKLLTKAVDHQFNEIDYSKYFGNWDTVSNPAETWCMENAVKPSGSKNEASVLPQRPSPQRSRNNKKVADSSTNTNYLDFSLVSDENLTGVKILTGNINNIFSENIPEVKQNMVETLFLDKSTMTLDESASSVSSYDTTQITSLFPNIPEKYILDMVERCQGDIDWAVDVLLDSEHIIAPFSIELEDNSNNSYVDEVELDTRQTETIGSQNFPNETSPKREPKSPTHEQTELKKLIESSVVFDRSHYSDKVLKVLKRKHPEYVHLIEKSPPPEDRNVDKSETADGSQDECKTEDEVDEVEEESSSSGCDVETEDDTMNLIMSNDLILQLQQKFGTSSLPKIYADMTPIVKLPLSFARQLFGYIMDSLQSDMDEQQSLIEEMIARDEEVARLLQFQDQNSRPQLQEVMDMEIALAMHRADQEEMKEKGTETLAAKLSRNILLEKFPQVDPRMLAEVLQAHNYSLADTVDSLTLGLGMGPVPEKVPQELPKEEKERVTSIIVSDDVGATGPEANSVSEAEAHRAQAASYYSLRMECLGKAHDAFRSGNKTVATYYSQLAQIHKERMEQSNSKAAACLFSSHKTGANTLDLHFLHIREAEVVLDMFLDEVVTYISERNKRHQTVFLITGRGLRSVGGVSRIKPMVQRKLQGRGIPYNEVNPGMLSALVRNVTPLSYTL